MNGCFQSVLFVVLRRLEQRIDEIQSVGKAFFLEGFVQCEEQRGGHHGVAHLRHPVPPSLSYYCIVFNKEFGCFARLLQTDFPVLGDEIHAFVADDVGDFCRIEFVRTAEKRKHSLDVFLIVS